MSKKVCFYIHSLMKNGAQRVIVNLAHAMIREGYEVTIVTTRIETRQEEYTIDPKIGRVISDLTGEEISKSRIRNFFARLGKLRRIWKTEKPDLIVSFIGKNNIMSILSSRFLGIPVVVSVRSAPWREYRTRTLKILSKTVFWLARGVVVQTEQSRDYFPGYIRKKAVILPNPLDPAFMRERWEGERENEIVTIGRLDDNKNQQMLIEAFCGLKKEYPDKRGQDVKLILYGTGENMQKLKSMAQKSACGERILFPGEVDRVEEIIYRSRILVLTSKVEGMPNALLEAMSLGLACISTDCPCGGPRSVIRDGENGLLIPVGDTDALTKALQRVLDDPALEEKLGKNAAALQKELAPEKVNRMWMEYMESCIRSKRKKKGKLC